MTTKPSLKIDFVIAGEPKSGTTALAHFLGQHPEVCLSIPKEPNYFATDFQRESDAFHGKPVDFRVRSKKEFQKLFRHSRSGEHLFAEASTGYLYSKEAAANIFEHNSKAKIIIMLREPTSFLQSLHMQYVNESTEDETDFAKALALEEKRKNDWTLIPKSTRCPSYLYYSERIKYAEQVKRFYKYFPKNQVLILLSEEFAQDNAAAYTKVVNFLGIDPGFQPQFSQIHGSKKPRVKTVNRLLRNPEIKVRLQAAMGQQLYTTVQKKAEKVLLKPQNRGAIPEYLQHTLHQQVAPEVIKIGRVINRDVSSLWGY